MSKELEKELWDKCVAFHGHECGGLTIGFKASLYAMKLLKIGFKKIKLTFMNFQIQY